MVLIAITAMTAVENVALVLFCVPFGETHEQWEELVALKPTTLNTTPDVTSDRVCVYVCMFSFGFKLLSWPHNRCASFSFFGEPYSLPGVPAESSNELVVKI